MLADESTPLPCGPPVIQDRSFVLAGALLVHYSFTVGTHIQSAFVQHNYRTKKVLVFSIRLYGRIGSECSCLNCGGCSLFQITILSATDLSFLVCSQWMNRISRY